MCFHSYINIQTKIIWIYFLRSALAPFEELKYLYLIKYKNICLYSSLRESDIFYSVTNNINIFT